MSTKNNEGQNQQHSATYQAKLAVHRRDQYTCIGCREQFDDISELDVDHIVSRGAGGSNTVKNKTTLCRRCHEAKHGERDHAPTIRFTSTGDMVDKDFRWYRRLWKEQFPAITEVALDYRIQPKFSLSEDPFQAWHIPLGDLRRADEILAKADVNYDSVDAIKDW
jgi:hypothetical protein